MSAIHQRIRYRGRKLAGRGRCPVCGRRLLKHRSSRRMSLFNDWEAENLEQLLVEMGSANVASLIGISRWELERRCRSLGVRLDGTLEEDE